MRLKAVVEKGVAIIAAAAAAGRRNYLLLISDGATNTVCVSVGEIKKARGGSLSQQNIPRLLTIPIKAIPISFNLHSQQRYLTGWHQLLMHQNALVCAIHGCFPNLFLIDQT